MTITIAAAVAHIQARPPAPVIFIDTCSFLDLFRPDETQSGVSFKPRAPHQEIQTAAELLNLVRVLPNAAHLIVPELIPREYVDHADAIQTKFGKWTELHDQNQDWLFEASLCVAAALPMPYMVHSFMQRDAVSEFPHRRHSSTCRSCTSGTRGRGNPGTC